MTDLCPRSNHSDWRPVSVDQQSIEVVDAGSGIEVRVPSIPGFCMFVDKGCDVLEQARLGIAALGLAKRRITAVNRLTEAVCVSRVATMESAMGGRPNP